jgi:hypothetical protein
MAFMRSPVRSRSGPPTFARFPHEGCPPVAPEARRWTLPFIHARSLTALSLPISSIDGITTFRLHPPQPFQSDPLLHRSDVVRRCSPRGSQRRTLHAHSGRPALARCRRHRVCQRVSRDRIREVLEVRIRCRVLQASLEIAVRVKPGLFPFLCPSAVRQIQHSTCRSSAPAIGTRDFDDRCRRSHGRRFAGESSSSQPCDRSRRQSDDGVSGF